MGKDDSRTRRSQYAILVELMFLLSIGLVGCKTGTPTLAGIQTTLTVDSATPTTEDADIEMRLAADLPKPIYLLHEPITFTLTWQVTRGWLIALSTNEFYDFKISLLNSQGKPVPYTDAGQNLCDQIGYWRCDTEDGILGGGARGQYRLDAEKPSFEEEFYLSDYFNVSTIGTYTLTVTTRNVIDSSAMRAGLEARTQAVSQPITFTVVSP